jgi:hypothetical protein
MIKQIYQMINKLIIIFWMMINWLLSQLLKMINSRRRIIWGRSLRLLGRKILLLIWIRPNRLKDNLLFNRIQGNRSINKNRSLRLKHPNKQEHQHPYQHKQKHNPHHHHQQYKKHS